MIEINLDHLSRNLMASSVAVEEWPDDAVFCFERNDARYALFVDPVTGVFILQKQGRYTGEWFAIQPHNTTALEDCVQALGMLVIGLSIVPTTVTASCAWCENEFEPTQERPEHCTTGCRSADETDRYGADQC